MSTELFVISTYASFSLYRGQCAVCNSESYGRPNNAKVVQAEARNSEVFRSTVPLS